MKSQYIKIRNIDPKIRKESFTVRVKPWPILFAMLIFGIALLVFRSYMLGFALFIIILSVFALTVMPDRILLQFTPDYLLMYNRQDRSECTMLYWDEIVTWSYEYHASSDLLVVKLINDQTEQVDMYSKWIIVKRMQRYAAGKELKKGAVR